MENLLTLMCFGAIILIAVVAFVAMMSRNRGAMAAPPGAPYGTTGNEMPRYDDPNVQSGGSFGGSFGSRPSGSAMPSTSHRRTTLGEDRPRNDDPNVRSGGSFGG
jgi:hypothetical protein